LIGPDPSKGFASPKGSAKALPFLLVQPMKKDSV
jgi:hypothetical protein